MPNINFCILNERENITPPLNNWTYYFDIQDQNTEPEKKWRYAGFLEYFSIKKGRFLRSGVYLSHIVSKIKEIIVEKDIQVLVFEQTGILMWSWHRAFSDKVKCVLRIHDSQYHYLLSDIRIRKKIISKIALLGSAFAQRRFESAHIRQWDQIQFLSQKEHQYYGRSYSDIAETFVYTPSSIVVQRNEYLLKPEKSTDILFVGTMNWKPNTDAVKWFLSQVLPLIKSELPNIKIKIIGKNAKQKINTTDKNIDVIGFVPSLDHELKSTKIFINPAQSGGGIKVKLMHASSYGIPIVSTSYGVLGFKDNIQNCLLINDKPLAFANHVIRMIRSNAIREEYSRKIFKYAQTQFNIQINQKKWKEEMNKII